MKSVSFVRKSEGRHPASCFMMSSAWEEEENEKKKNDQSDLIELPVHSNPKSHQENYKFHITWHKQNYDSQRGKSKTRGNFASCLSQKSSTHCNSFRHLFVHFSRMFDADEWSHSSCAAVDIHSKIAITKDVLTAKQVGSSGMRLAVFPAIGELNGQESSKILAHIMYPHLSPNTWWVMSGLNTLSSLWMSDSFRTGKRKGGGENRSRERVEGKHWHSWEKGLYEKKKKKAGRGERVYSVWNEEHRWHSICTAPACCQRSLKCLHLQKRRQDTGFRRKKSSERRLPSDIYDSNAGCKDFGAEEGSMECEARSRQDIPINRRSNQTGHIFVQRYETGRSDHLPSYCHL